MFKKFIKNYWMDIVFILLISLLVPLFFYKLGQTSLVSWDEAWYAEIAKNILKTGNLFELLFNGSQYFDHPPAGFWATAVSFKIFGINNFSARAAQASFGFLSLYAIYFLGRELFSKTVGFLSAIGLCSSFWFLTRARSGNLDAGLTFLFLLTFLFAFKAAKSKNFLIPFSLSLTLLCLTKSLVPFVILPSIVLIFWNSKSIKETKFKLSLAFFIVVFGGWMCIQIIDNHVFINHYLNIGAPGVSAKTSLVDNLKLAKDYLHNGVGIWFWPGVLSIFLGLFLRQKRFYSLGLFFIVFFLPFIFSDKGQIWHLIPLHPILIISFLGFSYIFLLFLFNKYFSKNKYSKTGEFLIFIILFTITIYWGRPQINQVWQTAINVPPFISDEEILSREAGKDDQDYILDDDWVPAAVFYSGKHVQRTDSGISNLFSNKQAFILVTKQWRLDEAKIDKNQYKILKSDRDKILVLKNNEK